MGSPLFSARLLTAQTPLQTLSTLRLCSSFCWPSAPWLLLRRPSTRVPMSNSSTLTVTTRLLTPTQLPLPSKPSNTPPPPSNTWLPPSKPSNMLLLTPTNTELILTLPLPAPALRLQISSCLRCLSLWCLSLWCLPIRLRRRRRREERRIDVSDSFNGTSYPR